MEIQVIEKLIQAMENSSLSKLEVEQEGIRIFMEKGSLSAVRNSNSSDVSVQEGNEEQEKLSDTKYEYITAPMVGTFYAKAAPNQQAFVNIGERVKKGQIVCIIESMKLMNEIEAFMDGRIVDIHVTDGEMVEYGQKLFEICPE